MDAITVEFNPFSRKYLRARPPHPEGNPANSTEPVTMLPTIDDSLIESVCVRQIMSRFSFFSSVTSPICMKVVMESMVPEVPPSSEVHSVLPLESSFPLLLL